MLDPGIGFGKTPEQSITVIARLGELRASACRCWSGLAQALHRLGLAVEARANASAARSRPCAGGAGGADIVRVHDVAETVQALRVAGDHEGDGLIGVGALLGLGGNLGDIRATLAEAIEFSGRHRGMADRPFPNTGRRPGASPTSPSSSTPRRGGDRALAR